MDALENYFKEADRDNDGKIGKLEGRAFLFARFGLPYQVVDQILMCADHNGSGFLGRQEFFYALRMVTMTQYGNFNALTPEIVIHAFHGPIAAQISAPQIKIKSLWRSHTPQVTPSSAMPQFANPTAPAYSQKKNNAFPPTQNKVAGTWRSGLSRPSPSPSPLNALEPHLGSQCSTSAREQNTAGAWRRSLGWSPPSASPSPLQVLDTHLGSQGSTSAREQNTTGSWRRSLGLSPPSASPSPLQVLDTHLGSQGSTSAREQNTTGAWRRSLGLSPPSASPSPLQVLDTHLGSQGSTSSCEQVEESQNALLKELDLCKIRLHLLQEENKKWQEERDNAVNASLSVVPSFKSQLDDKDTPSYFICPISQEVMTDPHIAADGYTYEVEAIKGWLDGRHKTSPMTNLPLEDLKLTPNHALRSAIQEWLQQHP